MRQAGASIVTPFDAGLAGATDDVWLSAIGRKHWLALMRDQNIRRRPLERQALVAAGVGAFVCIAGEATAVEITGTVVALLPKMMNVAITEPRPFIFTFGLGKKLRRVPRRELV
jgi:hypothetical protein